MKKTLVRNIIGLVFLIIMLILSTVFIVQVVKIDDSSVKIYLDSNESENVDIALKNMLPGYEHKYDYLVKCKSFDKFSLKFTSNQVNELVENVDVAIMADSIFIFKGKMLDLLNKELQVGIDESVKLEIMYSIPLSVGNEITGKAVELKIEFTVGK